MKIFHLKDGKMEKWSLWHKKWRQKEEFFKKQWNKQGKWVYNDPKMIETISNARNIGDVSTEIKEALAVKAKVKLYTKRLPSFLKMHNQKEKR